MGEWIGVEAKGAQSKAYLSVPPAGSGPGVILCHAWWGLNGCFQDLCDRLADDGFVVLAPDLYHGYVATSVDEAEIGANRLDYDLATAQSIAAATFLVEDERVTGDALGAIGFSLGSSYSMGLADKKKVPLAASVNYYGNRGGNFKNSAAAFLHHFAETDEYMSAAAANKLQVRLRGAGRPVTAHTYPGTTHWFAEPDQPAYDEAAAELAWTRTITFLRENLTG